MNTGGTVPPRHYTWTFLCTYFLYYSGYALFSSYLVSYLAQRGMSAAVCGAVTSLTLLVSVLMQPVAGYLTDTYLTIKQYLKLSVAIICILCLLNTAFASNTPVSFALIVVSAGFFYPFIQLMDGWVTCSGEVDDRLVYSRVRAGGSIGYAVAAVAAGYYFGVLGYDSYFLLQAACFIAIVPFLKRLPILKMGNRCQTEGEGPRLGFFQSFAILLKIPSYRACLLLFSLYWMSHRPIGSYLALITASFGGGDLLYGSVCGVGAAAEFLVLLAIAGTSSQISERQMLTGAILLCAARPMLLLAGSVPLLYLGQITQSISFALYFAASTACFTRFADPRIRSFSISVGLTTVSVVGTVGANSLGGILFDQYGTAGSIGLSLLLSLINMLVLILVSRVLFREKHSCLPGK